MSVIGATPQIAKDLLNTFKVAIAKATKTSLVGVAPVFRLPGLSQFADLVIYFLCEIIFREISKSAEITFVETKTISELNAYLESISRINQTEGADQKALSDARAAFAKLISWHRDGGV